MTFTPINVVNGSTPANATWGANAQTQYQEAILSYGPDFFGAGFVLTGMVCTKDGSVANQLDVTAGAAYLLQAATDSTFRGRRPPASTPGQFTTSVASTTYFLDLNPDGTFSWGTSHSAVVGHLTICSVTTDGSGNILAVTDLRPLYTTMFPAALGNPGVPLNVAQALRVHVTATTLQTILSFTPSATGLYRVSGTFVYVNPVQQKPQFSVQFTDPDLNVATVADFFALSSNSAGELMSNGQATIMGNNQVVACAPMEFNAKAGVAILVQFQDGGGTPADVVTAIIERLA